MLFVLHTLRETPYETAIISKGIEETRQQARPDCHTDGRNVYFGRLEEIEQDKEERSFNNIRISIIG